MKEFLKNKLVYTTIATIISLFPYISKTQAFTGTGSGIQSDPYKITNISQLQEINNELNAYYVLNNNINATETQDWNWDGEKYQGFDPIGNESNKFTGNLNGEFNTINNLHINRPWTQYVGLFACTDTQAQIQNINITNANITGLWYVGGLIGENSGTINNSHVSGNINNFGQEIGGIIGHNSGTINNSYNSSTINGNRFVGGITGLNQGIVNSCYNKGIVNGTFAIGGLVGKNEDIITNSYNSGEVNGISGFGGLIGGESVGGVCNNCFWDIETSGQTESACGTGKTSLEMKVKSLFTNAGWDFDNVWDIIQGETYAFLRGNNQAPNSLPQFYGIFAGKNQGTHKFGDDAEAIYNALYEYPGINHFNLKLIEPIDLETTINQTIDILQPQDQLWIFYSGHGGFVNNDTEPKIDNSLLVNLKTGEPNNTGDEYLVFEGGIMSDDLLSNLLNQTRIRQTKKTILLDCCMSGGFWGQPGNETDFGDLDKLENTGFLAACKENHLSFSYTTFALPGKKGRGKFSYVLEQQLKIQNGFAPADINQDKTVSFNELKTVMDDAYVMEIGDTGIIRDMNFPWINEDIEVTIESPNDIPTLFSEHQEDFDPNSSMLEKIVGDLNNDQIVNQNDLSIFCNRWLETGCNNPRWCEGADLNYDEVVNFKDFAILSKNITNH